MGTAIKDLFIVTEGSSPSPYRILIEGASGIGKTTLSKEIAVQWANQLILHNTKLLFLLFMRDPQVKFITNVSLLVNYFLKNDTLADKIASWLLETEGKYLCIVLDGYDEISEGNENSFIYDIVNHQILTKCGLVITSHPTAFSRLHEIMNCRAEVLGFTDKEKKDFIQHALQHQNEKVKEFDSLLSSNPFLDKFCCTPQTLSMLLCFTKDNINTLPSTQTKLFETFVMMTITHFLKKDEKVSTATFKMLGDLPHPYDQVVKELSQFAFLMLQKNQLVFTLAEIRALCPSVTPANWYGLGLLKPAWYFKPQDGCDHESFHFLHFAIQEYMAAYHIASLSDQTQLQLLNDTFWNVQYYNTWVFYISIAGNNNVVFRHFLTGNYFQISSWIFGTTSMSSAILSDKIKCLHLLHCLAEAGHEMLSSVENIFHGGIIDLSHQSLSPDDVHTLAILLLRLSNKQWEMINLSHCNIDDRCCDVLCEMLCSQRVPIAIKCVDISYNCFHRESLSKLCNILKSWHTKELILSVDSLYNSTTMTAVSSFNDNLRNYMKTNLIPSIIDGVVPNTFNRVLLATYAPQHCRLFAVYCDPGNVSCFLFDSCKLNDDSIQEVASTVKRRFVRLSVPREKIVLNCTITDTEALTCLLKNFQLVKVRGSNLQSTGAYILSKTLAMQYEEDVKSPHRYIADYFIAVLHHDAQTCASYLGTLPVPHAKKIKESIAHCFNNDSFSPCVLNCINNKFSSEAAGDIAVVLSHCCRLQQLWLHGNDLETAGAITIAKALQTVTSLSIFILSKNSIGSEAADDIAAVLSCNTKLKGFCMHMNNLGTLGAIKIARALQNTSSLTWLSISNNNIGSEAANDIITVLSKIPNYKGSLFGTII
ncbi:protein NLRC3-like [Dysidea avara]|uniref:protein NLRC3-like n=1 Tax=Dysidea avara TaxID=196820 RepID=UPI00333084BE